MLEKNLFKVSALSLEDVAFVPFGFERDGIDGLVFNLEFAYFKNALGLLFYHICYILVKITS